VEAHRVLYDAIAMTDVGEIIKAGAELSLENFTVEIRFGNIGVTEYRKRK
jgi:hypothetical protein